MLPGIQIQFSSNHTPQLPSLSPYLQEVDPPRSLSPPSSPFMNTIPFGEEQEDHSPIINIPQPTMVSQVGIYPNIPQTIPGLPLGSFRESMGVNSGSFVSQSSGSSSPYLREGSVHMEEDDEECKVIPKEDYVEARIKQKQRENVILKLTKKNKSAPTRTRLQENHLKGKKKAFSNFKPKGKLKLGKVKMEHQLSQFSGDLQLNLMEVEGPF